MAKPRFCRRCRVRTRRTGKRYVWRRPGGVRRGIVYMRGCPRCLRPSREFVRDR